MAGPARAQASPTSLPTELPKVDHLAFAKCFHRFLVNVWVTGEANHLWKHAIIQVLDKKKDRIDCNSCRVISLFAHAGKV